MAFLVPNRFAPVGNSLWGRMWVWVDRYPVAPPYAHFTMVELAGSGNGTMVRPVGGQYIPGQGEGHALWGSGADGGATGDWLRWQPTTPTADARWTCMEWQLDASRDAVNVWIDGLPKPELSVSTNDHGGNNVPFKFPTFDKIRIGWQLYQGGTTPNNFEVWIDDIALAGERVGCGAGAVPQPVRGLQWRGVALAGAEFGAQSIPGTYNTHYTYPTAAQAAYFGGKRMNTVRLPFLWERLQPALNGPLDAAELGRLKAFVDATTAGGQFVLLDPHNYARWGGQVVGSAAVPNTAFADLWRRLASEFKAYPKVMFGLMNEPREMPTEQWLAAANAAIAAIRATGADQVVTVPGNAWTGAHSWLQNWYGTPNGTVMKGIVDPLKNFVVEVHQYLDADSSGTSATCTGPTIGSQRLADFTAWARANGVRALLGEIGAASNATCNAAVADALTHLQNNPDVWAGWVWWAAGPWWGDYMYSIEPSGGTDKPQMSVLQPFLP